MSAAPLEIRGKGLHSGEPATLRIAPRESGSGGLRFLWPGLSLGAEDLDRLIPGARRGTVLQSPDGKSIRTPEHLLAAALFFADCPLDIACDASEPPGLDGSARLFFEALQGVAEQATPGSSRPAWREFSSRLNWGYSGPEGDLLAEPAQRFSVEYILDRPPLTQSYWLSEPEAAIREIIPARTFIFWREWEVWARQPGLLDGAGLESGLLYAESEAEFEAARQSHPEFAGRSFPLLHPGNERMPQEAVKHKILDLLGDLALAGLALPRLRLRIRNGGHALNHKLLERLRHE